MRCKLIADGRADEVGPVGIKTFLHQQVDLPEVHHAQIDGDLRFAGLRSQFMQAHVSLLGPLDAILVPSSDHLYRCHTAAYGPNVKGPSGLDRVRKNTGWPRLGRPFDGACSWPSAT